MLGRLISDILGRRRTPASPGAFAIERELQRPSVPAPARAAALPSAERASDRLPESKTLWDPTEIASRLLTPSTPEEAQGALRITILPALDACIQANDAVAACALEDLAYGRLINVFEEPSHYEACFGLMDEALVQLGVRGRSVSSPGSLTRGSVRRLLFLLHNLESSMAHVVLLCDLIDGYLKTNPDDASSIGLIGGTQGEVSPRVRELRQRWGGIHVLEVERPRSHAELYRKSADALHAQEFDRLIVVGAPLGVSFLTGLLGPTKIGWLSMKFELSCFEQLRHRCSFVSGLRRARKVDGRTWLEAPPFFSEAVRLAPSDELPEQLVEARRFGTVFYTINREQKIRNPAFLEAVAQILEQVPDSCFVWTGRKRLRPIDEFFAARGLAERHLFAGWVHPDDLVACGDVFLDTPVLSGTMAARAVACGRPVMTWTDAHSWVNFFVESHFGGHDGAATAEVLALTRGLGKSGLSWDCATAAEYVNQAVRLALDLETRRLFGEALLAFANTHFFAGSKAAEAHFANLRAHVEPDKPSKPLEFEHRSIRRIEWVVDTVHGSRETGWKSDHASVRYRALLPAIALGQAGAEVSVVRNAEWYWPAAGLKSQRADVVVIGKIFVDPNKARFEKESRHVLAQVVAAKTAGAFVVADFVDDHFERPDVGETWRTLAATVSACVASTETMAARVREFTKAPVMVVGDPLASPRGRPQVFRPGTAERSQMSNVLRLAWYGHRSNWASLLPWIELLDELVDEQPYQLTIVTEPRAEMSSFVQEFNQTHGQDAQLDLVAWSEDAQWQAVRDADVVLIPSDPQNPKKAVKSTNRLTDALNAGRYVIASPLPAYAPFAAFVSLTEAPVEALRWYLTHPEEALQRIERGQAAAQAACGLDVIAAQWECVFDSASPSVPGGAMLAPVRPARSSTNAPVKLNLGCGDKILPGYVNVDVVEARAGKAPDVLCDLRELTPFADDCADEVMSVHVVEHFWRWEVEDVLKEWVRVLKPGGKFIVECPNLQAACEAFLADPDARSAPDKRGQTTMWVFYGDPQWKDPLMVHRWGYTPNSLGQLLRSVGLVDVRQEPAQYKLREPRDMRVVGFKPYR